MPHNGNTPPAADGLRLLVVDDNRDAADTLSMLLRYWGHQPVVAYDAAAALRVAAAEPPDAILLDLAMPVCDGFRVAAELRRADGLAEVPLIALTGYGAQEYRDQAAAAGFDLYLVKPVDELALQAVLVQLAEVKRMAQRVAALTSEGHELAGQTWLLAAGGLRHLHDIRKTRGTEGRWAPRSGDGSDGQE